MVLLSCCAAAAQAAELSNGSIATSAPRYSEHQDLSYYLDDRRQRHGIETPSDWHIRRKQILQHIEAVMGKLPNVAALPSLDIQIVSEEVTAGVQRRKLLYHTDSKRHRVAAWLLEPVQSAHRLPAVLCLHPTSRLGKDQPAGLGGKTSRQYALQLAQRGFITLAPDYPSMGEYVCDFSDDGYDSGSMKAIVDNIRAVDLLSAWPNVDPQRIGCFGHSLGGHNTMFTTLFEPRIVVAASSCGFTRFHKYYSGDLRGWSSEKYMPKIASHYHNDPDKLPFDFTEIVAGLAPRPFLAIAPVEDHNFEVSGVRDVIAAAQPIYALLGKPANLQVEYPECGHDFPPQARERAYAFLDQHLLQPDNK